jgi:hypothetical protein
MRDWRFARAQTKRRFLHFKQDAVAALSFAQQGIVLSLGGFFCIWEKHNE